MPTVNFRFNFLAHLLSSSAQFATTVSSQLSLFLFSYLKNPFLVVLLGFEQGMKANQFSSSP